jgi:predicted alpha/beta hydrolase
VQVSDLPIAALDGCELAATVFTPAGPPDRVAIISAAIAVPGTFYRQLARPDL